MHAEPVFFRPKGWAVGTELPEVPKQTEKRTPVPEGEIVFISSLCTLPSGEFMLITRSLFPIAITRNGLDTAYEGAKKGLLGTLVGRLVSEETIAILGRESRRYRCEASLAGRPVALEARATIVGNELFVFMLAIPEGNSPSAAARAFFEKISETGVVDSAGAKQ